MSSPTSGPSSTPTSASTSASTPSFFGSILSAPGAVASGFYAIVSTGVGHVAGRLGLTPQETVSAASNPAVVDAAVAAARASSASSASSAPTPADMTAAVVRSPVVETAVVNAVETNSSSSSAPRSRIAEIKARLAEASKGKNTSAVLNARLKEYNELTKQPHKVYEAGGGGPKTNVGYSQEKYATPRMGHAFEVYQKQAYLATPQGELDVLRKQLTAAIEEWTSGIVDNDKEVTALEKLVAAKQAEVDAYKPSKKSRTRKSRQRRARRQTRRSRH
jgi:hypothetical protein